MQMRGVLSILAVWIPAMLLPAVSGSAAPPGIEAGRTGPAKVLLEDEFNMAGAPKGARWTTVRGKPRSTKGKMTLAGAEIQSRDEFCYGEMRMSIESSEWIPQDVFTDSSFGFEFWGGKNGKCHYAVLFKPSGHLALLNAKPDAAGECFGDPVPGEEQAYVSVSNWDQLRTTRQLEFVLTWRADGVKLTVRDPSGRQGEAEYSGPVLPSIPLRARLYAHTFEDGRSDAFAIDYMRITE